MYLYKYLFSSFPFHIPCRINPVFSCILCLGLFESILFQHPLFYPQVTDDLVNEFYCDLLDLEESGEVGSVEESRRRDTGGRGSSQRASCSPRRHAGSDSGMGKSSPSTTAKDHHKHKWHEGKKEGDGVSTVLTFAQPCAVHTANPLSLTDTRILN